MRRWQRIGTALPLWAAALALSGCAAGTDEPVPVAAAPDTAGADLKLLQSRIENGNSATLVLDRWCEERGLAPAQSVVADKIADDLITPSAEVAQQLAVPTGEQVVLRHVRLRCGRHVLSEARLWYFPSRMPAEIFTALRTTDIAFGRAVGPLNFKRSSLGARAYYTNGHLPSVLFDQRAILTLPDGRALAYVHEDYLPGVLDQP